MISELTTWYWIANQWVYFLEKTISPNLSIFELPVALCLTKAEDL